MNGYFGFVFVNDWQILVFFFVNIFGLYGYWGGDYWFYIGYGVRGVGSGWFVINKVREIV